MDFILSILSIFWILAFIYEIYILYIENSKPYLSEFLAFSLREAPNDKKLNELSILMDRKIGVKTFVSTFFYLMEKGAILVQKQANDILFTNANTMEDADFSLNEKYLFSIFFGGIGGKEQFKLSDIVSFGKVYLNRTNFLMEYTVWKRIALKEVKEEYFEEKKGFPSVLILSILGGILIFMNAITGFHHFFIYALCFPIFFLYFYFFTTYKRTKSANTEYFKWTSYKRYILNLSSYIKDIPYSYIVGLIGLYHVKEKVPEEKQYMVEIEKVLTKLTRDAILKGGRNI